MRMLCLILCFILIHGPVWAARGKQTKPKALNPDDALGVSARPSDLELRISRWLDRLPLSQSVPTVSLSATSAPQKRDLLRLRFKALLDRFYDSLSPLAREAEQPLKTLGSYRAELERDPLLGPQRQQLLVALAAWHWQHDEEDKALSLIRQAARVHPEGQILDLRDWDWDEGGVRAASFQEEALRVSASVSRPCRFRFKVVPGDSELRINGFSVRAGAALRLRPQKEMLLQVMSSGYQPLTRTLSCSKFGSRSLSFRLERSDKIDVASKRESGTMLVMDRSGEDIDLFLYTKGFRVDAVPVSRPVRLADASGGSLPIATDEFVELVQTHQLAMNMKANRLAAPAQLRMELDHSTAPEWYEDWKVWAVIGGVIGGVAITYLATRNPNISTQTAGRSPGVRIRIK